MKKFLKAVFAIIGAVILIDGVALFFVSNFNLGNFLTVLLGGMIILLCLKFDELARWFKILLVAGISRF